MYQAINEGLALALENDPRTGEYSTVQYTVYGYILFKKKRNKRDDKRAGIILFPRA